METSFAVLALAWLSALAFIYKKLRNSPRLPPGPMPWPIIGNLFQLGTLPHITLDMLSKQYGEIMRVKFGMKNVVIASSPKMAEEFLKVQDSSFASRPALASGKYIGYDFKDMLWAPYGDHWKLARKVYLSELLSPTRLNSFEQIRIDENRNLMANIFAKCGSNDPIIIKDYIRRYTLTNICRLVLGDTYFSDSRDGPLNMSFEDFHEMIDEWMLLNGVANIGDWIPFLQPFDLQGYIKRMKKVHIEFDKFHNHVIDDHKTRMEASGEDVPKDMIDVFLLLTREGTDPEKKITFHEMKGLIQDLMPGGTNTSATSIEWIIHELLRHPDALRKLIEELDRVIGPERWVEEADYSQLPYLDAVMKESARLHPAVPLLPHHMAIHDCKVLGYDIPKGTTVLINTWAIGRDPMVWGDPENFRPERFLEGKEISMTGKDFSLLPFGSGRRRCPGYALGLKVIRTTVGNLFHGFDFQLPEGFKANDICITENRGISTYPEVPISVIPKPRLSEFLYSKV